MSINTVAVWRSAGARRPVWLAPAVARGHRMVPDPAHVPADMDYISASERWTCERCNEVAVLPPVWGPEKPTGAMVNACKGSAA